MRLAAVTTVLAGVAALVLAASGLGGSSAAPEPIKIVATSNVVSQVTPFPAIMDNADIFAKWINARGGINGRPLEIINCDNHGDPNSTVACARKAVSEHAVAMIGWSYTAARAVPYLAAA